MFSDNFDLAIKSSQEYYDIMGTYVYPCAHSENSKRVRYYDNGYFYVAAVRARIHETVESIPAERARVFFFLLSLAGTILSLAALLKKLFINP